MYPLEIFKVEHLTGRWPIIVWQRPDRFSTSITIRVKFGAIHSHYLLNGLVHTITEGMAHVCEHLAIADRWGLQPVILAGGHRVTASTYRDFTLFRFSGSGWSRGDVQRIVYGLLTKKVNRAALARELKVISIEKAMRDEDQRRIAVEALCRELYPGSPVSRSVVGNPKMLMEITPEEIERCRNACYDVRQWEVLVSGADATRLALWVEAVLNEVSADPTLPTVGTHRLIRCHDSTWQGGPALEGPGVLAWGLVQKAPVTLTSYIMSGVITEALFGEGGQLRTYLSQKGHFPGALTYAYDCSLSYAHLWVTGYVSDGSATIRSLEDGWTQVANEGLPAELLRRTVDLLQLRYFGYLDLDDQMDLMFNHLRQIGTDPYSLLVAMSNIEPAELTMAARVLFHNQSRYVLSAS